MKQLFANSYLKESLFDTINILFTKKGLLFFISLFIGFVFLDIIGNYIMIGLVILSMLSLKNLKEPSVVFSKAHLGVLKFSGFCFFITLSIFKNTFALMETFEKVEELAEPIQKNVDGTLPILFVTAVIIAYLTILLFSVVVEFLTISFYYGQESKEPFFVVSSYLNGRKFKDGTSARKEDDNNDKSEKEIEDLRKKEYSCNLFISSSTLILAIAIFMAYIFPIPSTVYLFGTLYTLIFLVKINLILNVINSENNDNINNKDLFDA